jgi:hypothetical protein
MTKREKLSLRIDEVLVTYNTLVENYTNIVGENTKYEVRSFPDIKKEYGKLKELEGFISMIEKRIEILKNEIAIEKFYLTDEGIALKSNLEKKCETLYDNAKDFHEKMMGLVSEKILALLDDSWTVNACETRIEVGLKDTSDKGFRFLFGHSFDIYYNTWGADKLELNYGTMGSFDVLDPECVRPKYLLGLASIANNKELIIELTSIMKTWNDTRHEMFREIDKIEKTLKNPLAA